MFIDINTGNIVIDGVSFYPGFRFEDFKKTKFFYKQDGLRYTDLKKTKIDKYVFFPRLFWKLNKLNIIDLSIESDKVTCFEDEPKRKKIHDAILKEYGIDNGKDYNWGTIESVYDSRSCISSILIKYNYPDK